MPDLLTGAVALPDRDERWAVLRALEDWLETPMLVLSFVWLVLVVYELAAGTSQLLETFSTAISAASLASSARRSATSLSQPLAPTGPSGSCSAP